MTRFWSSRVSLPSTSSTRWITNMTSGRPASYSSKHSATGCCNAQGRMPSRNSVTCLLSRSTIASLPTRSMRLMWLSRLTRMQGQLSRAGDLLDMGRFAGAVIAADHDPAVEGEAGEDRQRRVAVEAVGVVEIGDVLARLAERRHLEIAVDAEGLADGDLDVGRVRPESAWMLPLAERMALLLVLSGVAGKGWAADPVWLS